MKRDLGALSTTRYDLLIIGGGIYGACAAWDAALRGLSVALIEQGDFGGATSANSQKIVHGGLRYLQSLDVRRMRESIRERRALLRVAPHLVRPLPFLLPTHGWGRYGKPALAAAMAANDLISWDRNHGATDPRQRIPAGRILSREECRRWAPELPSDGVTGGALWHDGQIGDSERLTLAFVRSAVTAGADAANYVRAATLLLNGTRVEGVQAEDVLSGRRLDIRARVVLNTRGPWVGGLLSSLNGGRPAGPMRFLKAVNLVTRPLLRQRVAVGIPARSSGGRTPGLIFITPWRGRSIIGSAYWPYAGEPEACRVSEDELAGFLEDVNRAFPAARLTRRDVSFVHLGLLPASPDRPSVLQTRYRLLDHQRLHGLSGLISTIGVKYTTARDVAEKAVDLVCAKLGRGGAGGLSRTTPVAGGRVAPVEAFIQMALRERPLGLGAPVLRHLIERHGSAYSDVLALARERFSWAEPVGAGSSVLKAEVIHAVRREMAVTLSDVVFRRTGLGSAGHPGAQAVQVCAELMAHERGWDAARTAREVDEVEAVFRRHGAAAAPEPAGAARPQRPKPSPALVAGGPA